MGRGAPSAMRRMPRHTQAGITAPGPARKHSNRRMMYALTCATRHIRTASHAISRNGPVLIADTHSGRARKWRMRIQNRDAPGRTTPHTRFPTHMLANNPSSAQPVRKRNRPGARSAHNEGRQAPGRNHDSRSRDATRHFTFLMRMIKYAAISTITMATMNTARYADGGVAVT
ncbi:hypothetical protein DSM100238_1666 [Bifidobacterium apri]|uniref:Uncharacterized protein n=1 Tax=Bifidobacterium apri TaxID=1769423 RepID=A0A6A2V708_9BIFI|nr:hypothetical protein DSM100238_1666 [Bifidobacterium apri]